MNFWLGCGWGIVAERVRDRRQKTAFANVDFDVPIGSCNRVARPPIGS
ncbi:hypothetical protein CKA32_006114 [Geitlerinema sp. FC II]|nr:hypothetical protein CKA32_006114 [Geitlerinema sp. FC II]